MKRFWLAREGEVYGPYELPQLREMNRAQELVGDDQLCQDGTETWMAFPAWRELHFRTTATAKVPVRGAGRQGDANSSHAPQTPALDPHRSGAEVAAADPAVSSSESTSDAEAGHKPLPEPSHDSIVHHCMHVINGGSAHGRGYGHPLKYVRKDVVEDVIEWLDCHHRGWEKDAWRSGADSEHAFDWWLVPAIAKLHPETIKETYKCEFGPRKRWRMF